MRFAFSDEQEELRRSVRRALGSPGLWPELLAPLIVPERHGGAGLGWVEVVAVAEELGRALSPAPFLSSVGLATAAILESASEEQQASILPSLAAGGVTAALVDGELTARPAPGDHVLLSGRARHVIDGDTADLLIVQAGALYEVPAGASGVRRKRLPTMDSTRALAEIVLDDVRVPATARLGDGHATAIHLGRIALAAEQVGAAQRCLDLSVEYAKVRHQFGRPIGSFQAIQHACADLFVLVESARSAVYEAGWIADHARGDLAAASLTAATYCGDAFYECAAQTIQIHGGIGFTWEHDAHRYFKRARASRSLLGAPSSHREAVAKLILGEP
jgi:alkylation response protein AidB-like acyl-CoA dehydrogenase